MNRIGGTVIVHVVERPTAIGLDFEAPLVQAGFDVQRVVDVYQAAARLVRGGDGDVLAVLVCIDCLDAPELEFFAIAAREWPDLPLYVYGQAMDTRRRDRALALGARAEIDPAHMVDALIERSERAAPVIAADTVATAGTPDQPEVAAEAERDTPDEPDETTEAWIPTPWQPTADRPQRVPPSRRAAQRQRTGKSEDTPSPHATDRDDALLTPQEVSALLSDESNEADSQG